MDKNKEAFDTLLTNVVRLYIDGILVQYGLSEEKALEIVTNLTSIPKEKIIELKQKRENGFLKLTNQITDNTINILKKLTISYW